MRCSAMTDDRAGRTEAYDYELPAELIAARPAARRDASRLLAVDRARGRYTDAAFPALLERLAPGDAVVVNDSRVFPARLLGRKPTGARAEILLVRPESDALEPFAPFDETDTRLWRAMVRPGGKSSSSPVAPWTSPTGSPSRSSIPPPTARASCGWPATATRGV